VRTPPGRAVTVRRRLLSIALVHTTPPKATMKAQVLEAFGQPYVYRDVDKPGAPQQKDILVRVEAASYCHTDAVFASGSMWKDLPRIGSHEFAGEVVALGEEVDPELGVTVGQRIGVPGRAYRPCGTCEECRENDGDPESYGVSRTYRLPMGGRKLICGS